MSYGVNAPQGLLPVGSITGAPYTAATRTYTIASGYGTSIFTNDPVAPLSDGTVGIGVVGSNSSTPTLGTGNGVEYTSSLGIITTQPYWAASTTVAANTVVNLMVNVDPNTVYDIQVNSANGAALTNNWNTLNFALGTGNTYTGISGATLDLTPPSGANQSYYNLKIIGLTPAPSGSSNPWSVGNNFGYNNVLVLINNHFFRSGVAGV